MMEKSAEEVILLFEQANREFDRFMTAPGGPELLMDAATRIADDPSRPQFMQEFAFGLCRAIRMRNSGKSPEEIIRKVVDEEADRIGRSIPSVALGPEIADAVTLAAAEKNLEKLNRFWACRWADELTQGGAFAAMMVGVAQDSASFHPVVAAIDRYDPRSIVIMLRDAADTIDAKLKK